MGQRLVIVSSPLAGCVYSLRLFVEICRFGAFSPGVVGFYPPLSVSFLSDVVAPFLEETVRSSRRFYVFQSSTWWSSVGLSSYPFLGVLTRVWSGFSPSLGWYDTGLVFFCFLAPRG